MKEFYSMFYQKSPNSLTREGIKLLEIEKCKKDISDVKNELYMAHKKMIDYNHLSPPNEARRSINWQRKSFLQFDKYTLSQETIDYLKQPTFDIWHWEPNEGIIMLVLATDMARHSEILDSFKSKLDSFDFNNEEHLNSMKMVMIKCCDISNEVRPFEVSEPWVDCLLEEYFNQVIYPLDREKEEGLPVAPFMDREKVTKPTAQIGFIKFVLIPMFETIAKVNK
ncbi:hypothetical protein LSH36_361g08022 [Paralvinella palmiformis]|uniref:PDEase domain-containing protein n=1 Tax=Paralvinella palmiformis TaxID=53620 RepID=A0AAD9JF78_9ANNE|nr:hypothetical protein LSH36_361g08022 [Paralvinella palmiformis]